MILEVLKYILVVIGIIIIGAFIIYALASLMLAIVDPHAKDNKNENQQQLPPYQQGQQIYYEQPKLLNQPEPQPQPYVEEKVEQSDVKDVDLEKAKQEELALSQGNNFASLTDEEDEYIKNRQKEIEERISAKKAKEQPQEEEEINLDDIFVDGEEEQEEEEVEPEVENTEAEEEEDDEEDIEALINRILAESNADEEEQDEEDVEEDNQEQQVDTSNIVAEEEEPAEEEEEPEQTVEEEEVQDNEQDDRIRELEEQLANKQKELEDIARKQEEMQEQLNRTQEEMEEQLTRTQEEYENRIKDVESAKEQEANDRIEQLQKELEEKEKQLQESENRPFGALSLEEYEARLETLKDRLAVNEKELRAVKKEYLPLAKIKKSYEKDKAKLRRKESLVAKQKVVLYGVNNYVDIDEEKAKKLAEDLDLLDGLRLSVQHCEEVLKQNEERYPILENSYNILLSTNENIKADIAECTSKIAELKSEQE